MVANNLNFHARTSSLRAGFSDAAPWSRSRRPESAAAGPTGPFLRVWRVYTEALFKARTTRAHPCVCDAAACPPSGEGPPGPGQCDRALAAGAPAAAGGQALWAAAAAQRLPGRPVIGFGACVDLPTPWQWHPVPWASWNLPVAFNAQEARVRTECSASELDSTEQRDRGPGTGHVNECDCSICPMPHGAHLGLR